MALDRPDPFSKWFRVLTPLFWLIFGVENLVRRNDVPFNTLLALSNSAFLVFILRKGVIPSWIRAVVSALFVIVGIAEIVLHHWVWGFFLVLTGVFLVMVLREEKVHSI